MKYRLLTALFAAVAIVGCAASPALLPETPLSRAQAAAMIAEGKAMVAQGESLVAQGESTEQEAKKLIGEGKDLSKQGEVKIAHGERLLKSTDLLEEAEALRLKGQGIKDKVLQ